MRWPNIDRIGWGRDHRIDIHSTCPSLPPGSSRGDPVTCQGRAFWGALTPNELGFQGIAGVRMRIDPLLSPSSVLQARFDSSWSPFRGLEGASLNPAGNQRPSISRVQTCEHTLDRRAAARFSTARPGIGFVLCERFFRGRVRSRMNCGFYWGISWRT
jgi:hypothetical protein